MTHSKQEPQAQFDKQSDDMAHHSKMCTASNASTNTNATAAANTAMNAALIARFSDLTFITQAIKASKLVSNTVIVSANGDIVNALSAALPKGRFQHIVDPVSSERSNPLNAFVTLIKQEKKPARNFIVDYCSVMDESFGNAELEAWSALTEQLTCTHSCTFITLYSLELLLEHQMQALLRAHEHFVVPSGRHQNPFWLPTTLNTRGTLDEQMAFLLARAIPDYTDMTFSDPSNRSFARGTNPEWIPAPTHIEMIQKKQQRWRIHCLGALKIQLDGQHQINWNLRGGSPKKARTLFAYLLNAGEKGAHVDRIAELLWPADISEKVKRARLHHAVAMLRKTLEEPNSVIRSGEFYRLNAPPGSWTDISKFEQACRRGLALFRKGKDSEALLIYSSAERLYSGDLFEDIPVEYVHNDLEDWCLPRRRWLREMAIKLYRDTSVLLRGQGRSDEALQTCQKALVLDPTNENANTEAMRIFHAQGRPEAITRQYHQYLSACKEAIGSAPETAEIHRLHTSLLHL